MARNAPIEDLLYGDALRRQEKGREVKALNAQGIKHDRPAINMNNERYVAQKFIKEYFNILERLEIPVSSKQPIDYLIFN